MGKSSSMVEISKRKRLPNNLPQRRRSMNVMPPYLEKSRKEVRFQVSRMMNERDNRLREG